MIDSFDIRGPRFSTEGNGIPITIASDVFSLGIVLGEILNGKRFQRSEIGGIELVVETIEFIG